jgi:hypothetical protein
MTVLLILLALPACIVGWALFAPINIYVNTWQNQAFAELYGIVRFKVLWSEAKPVFRLRIFFFEFTPGSADGKQKKKKKPRKKKTVAIEKMPGIALRFLHTFHLKRFVMAVDTGDYPTNALLVPLFTLANAWPNMDWSINFTGELGVECHIQNRVSRMLPVILEMRKLFY